jgi:hypothetical protein
METEYIQSLLAEIPLGTLSKYNKDYLHQLAHSVTAAVMGSFLDFSTPPTGILHPAPSTLLAHSALSVAPTTLEQSKVSQ